jgi:hypothetical protein
MELSSTATQIFRPYDLPAVKRISDGACPVVTWVPFPMTSFLRYAGPQELGGLEDLAALADYASAATGESVADASERLLRETHGQIVKTPGLPDLFDYEFFPQVVSLIQLRDLCVEESS